MKTVLFVPGFREDIQSRDYKSTMAVIENKGYLVKFVPIQWQRTTINDWVRELNKVYERYDPTNTILAGFSYGSLTAFISATQKNPAELWLFSLSPYFSDDMPKMKKAWLNEIGHRRADEFRKLDFNKLSKLIKCKTLLVVGEVEAKKYPLVGSRTKTAHKALANSKLVTAALSGHDVTDKNYIATIKDAI